MAFNPLVLLPEILCCKMGLLLTEVSEKQRLLFYLKRNPSLLMSCCLKRKLQNLVASGNFSQFEPQKVVPVNLNLQNRSPANISCYRVNLSFVVSYENTTHSNPVLIDNDWLYCHLHCNKSLYYATCFLGNG